MISAITPSKSGTEVVRERIQKAFRQIHTDLSSREAEEEQTPIDENANGIPTDITEKRVSACISAALRSPNMAKRLPLRSDLRRCYIVEEPSESTDTLIMQALRQLEGK